VELLAGCHKRDLQKLAGLKGRPRCVFLHRCRFRTRQPREQLILKSMRNSKFA
jgi:hypothetical protein